MRGSSSGRPSPSNPAARRRNASCSALQPRRVGSSTVMRARARGSSPDSAINRAASASTNEIPGGMVKTAGAPRAAGGAPDSPGLIAP